MVNASPRVLFVDDEKALAELTQLFFETLGVGVTTFCDPEEALNAFKADPGLYDVLITDLTMPAMPGDQLIREVQRLKPKLPCILCSGLLYEFDERLSDLDVVKVEKPYSLGVLHQYVLDLSREAAEAARQL